MPPPNWPETIGLLPFAAAPGAVLTVAITDLRRLEKVADITRLAPAVLAAAELSVFSRFIRHRRRLEWLAGRLAAKTLVAGQYPGTRVEEVAVLAAPHGRPTVHLPGSPADGGPHVSISHSGDAAVAVLSSGPAVGIDVQVVSDSVVTVRERFLSMEEMLLQAEAPSFAGFSNQERLTLLWAVKEAVRKSFDGPQLPPFREIVITAISAEQDSLFVHGRCPSDTPFTAGVALRQGAGLALTRRPA